MSSMADNLAPNVSIRVFDFPLISNFFEYVLYFTFLCYFNHDHCSMSCIKHIAWFNSDCNAMLKSFFLTLRDNLHSTPLQLAMANGNGKRQWRAASFWRFICSLTVLWLYNNVVQLN
jgi:hypothetical protein